MATSQVQTVNTSADKAKLVAAVALVIASLVAYYALGKQGQLFQWLGLLAVCLAGAIIVFLMSESGKALAALVRIHFVRSKKWCGLHAKRPFK